MAKKSFTVNIEAEHVEDVIAAVQDRKATLDKVGADLLKKKCGEAATPVFAAVKYLGELEGHIREQFNSTQ